MKISTVTNTALMLAAAIAIGLLIGHATGCAPLRKLDQAVWGSAPDTPGQPPDPGFADSPIGITVTEAVAALLASAGFGGMAGWIRKIRRAASNDHAANAAALEKMAARIHALENRP